MQYDRQITISAAGNRRASRWPRQSIYWSELVEKLQVPARGEETLGAYMALSKAKQDDLKDVGGFVAGALKGDRRKANNVLGRDVLTLDMDNIQPGQAPDVIRRMEGLGCAYALYSTRKHTPAAPRLRVLIPTARTVTADEYEPIARRVAAMVGIEMCDPTTFQASRMMYWPSCSRDSEYIHQYADKPFLSPDGVLKMYEDWKNVRDWPRVPGEDTTSAKHAEKQGDPTTKPGIVGTFCQLYDIYTVMDKFIPGIYEPTDIPDRYTFTGGSTAGGAVIYQNGLFLYSHHATDPAGGKLSNAFDLVRYHKFADLDEDVKPDTPVNRLPSYKAMCEMLADDPEIVQAITQRRHDEAAEDFGEAPEEDENWKTKLKLNPSTMTPVKTMNNLLIILENDPALKGKIAYDEFACRRVVLGPVPWNHVESRRPWTDTDDAGAQWYLEDAYHITGKDKILNALMLCAQRNSFDEVRDYLQTRQWDGVRRLDTLFIDYLGAPDTPYTRAVTRKAFTAAVTRVMEPGCKFDNMIILTGRQGIGKSTILKKMGRKWFNDSIKTFEGKEASEQIQGSWLIEIGEMEAYSRSEVGRIKQYLSQQEDVFRAAYGRHVQWYPRRCVFFGTSNNDEYLRDKSGNRRFWPLDVGVFQSNKNVFELEEETIGQIWAEAYARWQIGEPLYITGEIEKAAQEEQESHREHSVREGVIKDFVEQLVPEDWNTWPLDMRRNYWGGVMRRGELKLVPRERICAMEVWCEALGGDVKGMRNVDTMEINAVIKMIPGWERLDSRKHGYCGKQRGFEKTAI